MENQKFGKWTVLNLIKIDKPGKYYECICECGNIRVKAATELRAGRSKQCTDCQYSELYNPNKMIGKKFGKWTVIKFIDIHNKLQRFETQCDCGNKGIQLGSDLRRKKLRSSQCSDCHNRQNAKNNIKHGMHKSKTYKIWSAMIHRMTIDRINNDGDYEPSNCRWVSHKENCNNRSNKKIK